MKNNTKTSQKSNALVLSKTNEDFKNSVFTVSLIVNLVILTTWLVVKASSDYASQLSFLL